MPRTTRRSKKSAAVIVVDESSEPTEDVGSAASSLSVAPPAGDPASAPAPATTQTNEPPPVAEPEPVPESAPEPKPVAKKKRVRKARRKKDTPSTLTSDDLERIRNDIRKEILAEMRATECVEGGRPCDDAVVMDVGSFAAMPYADRLSTRTAGRRADRFVAGHV